MSVFGSTAAFARRALAEVVERAAHPPLPKSLAEDKDEHDPPPLVWGDFSHWDGEPPYGAIVERRWRPMADGRVPRVVAIVLKAAEGDGSPAYKYDGWFPRNAPRAVAAWGARFGVSGFVQPYDFARFDEDGAATFDYMARFLDRAGWLDDHAHGVLCPVIDVEWTARNERATTKQIVNHVYAWGKRCREVTGMRPMIYGGRLVTIERGIDPVDFGIDRVWVAGYGTRMPRGKFPASWIKAWQIAGKTEWGKFGKILDHYPYQTRYDWNVHVGSDTTLAGFARDMLAIPRRLDP